MGPVDGNGKMIGKSDDIVIIIFLRDDFWVSVNQQIIVPSKPKRVNGHIKNSFLFSFRTRDFQDGILAFMPIPVGKGIIHPQRVAEIPVRKVFEFKTGRKFFALLFFDPRDLQAVAGK